MTIRPQKVTIYATEDGRTFRKRKNAENHDIRLKTNAMEDKIDQYLRRVLGFPSAWAGNQKESSKDMEINAVCELRDNDELDRVGMLQNVVNVRQLCYIVMTMATVFYGKLLKAANFAKKRIESLE